MIRRVGEMARAAGALLVLAGTLAGIPAGLYAAAGSPLPRSVPSLREIQVTLLSRGDGTLLLGALALVGWAAWAVFAATVAVETVGQIRGRPAPRLPAVGGVQRLAGHLVASALLLFSSPAAAIAAPAPAGAATASTHTLTPVAHTETRPPAAGAGAAATATSTGHPGAAAEAETVTYEVAEGDCLWDIAQAHLGDGERWTEIWQLNRGRVMDGIEFTDPDLIYPGWELRLPARPGAREPDRPTQPVPRSPQDSHGADRGAAPEEGGATPVPTPSGNAESRAAQNGHTPRAAQDGRPAGVAPTPAPAPPPESPPPTSAPAPPAGQTPQHQRGAPTGEGQAETAPVRAPLLAAAGGLLAAGAVGVLWRKRRRQRQHRRPGRRIRLPESPRAQRAEAELRARAAPEETRALRQALQALAAALARQGTPMPPVLAVYLSQGALELWLASPHHHPPEPFTAAGEGMRWTLSPAGRDQLPDEEDRDAAAADDVGEPCDPLPGLVTLGRLGEGFVLANLEALRVTAYAGDPEVVDQVLATAALELAANPWGGWFQLVAVGFEKELGPLEDHRAQCHTDLERALDTVGMRSRSLDDRMREEPEQGDVAARRVADPDDDDMTLTLLVTRQTPGPEQMGRLLDMVGDTGGLAAAVPGYVADPEGRRAPTEARLSADRDDPQLVRVAVDQLDVSVVAQRLDPDEQAAICDLFATADDLRDVPPDTPPYDHPQGAAPTHVEAYGPVGVDAEAREAGDETGEAGDETGEAGDELADSGDEDLEKAEPAEQAARDGPSRGPADSASAADSGDTDRAHEDHEDADATAGAGRHTASAEGDQPPPDPLEAKPPTQVRLLGPFEVTGSAGSLDSAHVPELIVHLALRGRADKHQLLTWLGLVTDAVTEKEQKRAEATLRKIVSRAKDAWGPAGDGQPRILTTREHGGRGVYRLHDEVDVDWRRFQALVQRSRGGDRGDGAEDLRAALALVRGEPLDDCNLPGIDPGQAQAMRDAVADAAARLAEIELDAGDPSAAAWAAQVGLTADPVAEQLTRMRMRAEYDAGNAAQAAATYTLFRSQLADLADAQPHPSTVQLYRELTGAGSV